MCETFRVFPLRSNVLHDVALKLDLLQ